MEMSRTPKLNGFATGEAAEHFSSSCAHHGLTDAESGRTDPFPTLVDRNQKNPFDIEHIWASGYSLH
jgi:hypothetical protein